MRVDKLVDGFNRGAFPRDVRHISSLRKLFSRTLRYIEEKGGLGVGLLFLVFMNW